MDSYKTRDVIGPSGINGRLLKEAGHGYKTEKLVQERNSQTIDALRKKKEISERKFDNIRCAFTHKSELHCLLQRIRYLVEFGLKAADDDLNMKRDKLKVRLLEEESNLTHEYVDKAQQSANRIFEEKKKLVEEIEARKMKENENIVQDAYDKIFTTSSDEYRSLLTAENKKYCAKINKFQMRDKELAELKQKEEDRMWLTISDRLDKSLEEEEKYAQQTLEEAHKNFGHINDILEKQLKAKKMTQQIEDQLRKEEKEFWRKLDGIFREDEAILKERNRMIRENRKKELQQQIEETNRRNQENKDKEDLIDKIHIDQIKLEIEQEKLEAVDMREQERHEMDIFREALEQVRRSYQLEEEEVERLIVEEVRKLERIRKCNRDRLRKARKDLKDDVINSRLKQMEERIEREELEKKEKQAIADHEKFRLKQNDELDRLQTQKQNEDFRKYVRDLIEQTEFDRELERREANEMMEFLLDRKQQAKLHEERARKLLHQSQTRTALHPFMTAFQKDPRFRNILSINK